jgi:hypothetical protein
MGRCRCSHRHARRKPQGRLLARWRAAASQANRGPEHGEQAREHRRTPVSPRVVSRRSRKTGPGSRARTRVRSRRPRWGTLLSHEPAALERQQIRGGISISAPLRFRRVPITQGTSSTLASRVHGEPARLRPHAPGLRGVGRGLRGRQGAAGGQARAPRLEPGDRESHGAPTRLRERRRSDDAPVDPAPEAVGGRDHLGPTRRDDGHDQLRLRRDVQALLPVRRTHVNHRAKRFVCENCTLEF